MNRINPTFAGPLIFGGTAGRHLSTEVCKRLSLREGHLEVQKFSDGENGVKILDNVRGADCYLIQPTAPPTNDNLMELLLTIDAMRRASADRINVLIPYFGYARQDRKDQGRVALSAKAVAKMIETMGAYRVICIDLHSPQIQGFFDIPVDHLYASAVFNEFFRQQDWVNDVTVVSPDVGNVKMGRAYASKLNAPLAIIDKRRPRANESEVMNIIGKAQIAGRHCLIVDDLIDTAGTICNAAQALVDAGAKSVYACATHAVLSGPARVRLQESVIQRVIVTNTIHTQNDAVLNKLHVVDISPMLAQAIHRIHNFLSVSQLFDGPSGTNPKRPVGEGEEDICLYDGSVEEPH